MERSQRGEPLSETRREGVVFRGRGQLEGLKSNDYSGYSQDNGLIVQSGLRDQINRNGRLLTQSLRQEGPIQGVPPLVKPMRRQYGHWLPVT